MSAIEKNVRSEHSATSGGDMLPPAILAGIVEALGRALDLHGYRHGVLGETAAHTDRVTKLGSQLAERVSPELALNPQLAAGFRLHDIGMIGIPMSVLAKPGPLTADEVSELQEHPWLGERIVAPIAPLSAVARLVIASHHERWDGTGYPRGLRQTEIPLAARIFAVVDAYDSITNPQSYRQAVSIEAALTKIEAGAGTHFDPAVVAAFLVMAREQPLGPA